MRLRQQNVIGNPHPDPVEGLHVGEDANPEGARGKAGCLKHKKTVLMAGSATAIVVLTTIVVALVVSQGDGGKDILNLSTCDSF